MTTGSTKVPRLSTSKMVGGPAVSLASQGVGLAQLGFLLVRAGANSATDAYFYLFSMGITPTVILIGSVMYPLLINRQRMSQRGLVRVRWVTPLLCIVFVAVGALWLEHGDRLGWPLVPLVLVSAANAVAQSFVWFKAMCAQAAGDTRWISGVALPANLVATAIVLLPWRSAEVTVTAMVSGLVAGNLACLVVMTRLGIGDVVFSGAPTTAEHPRSGTAWFFGRASVGYVGGLLMQSTAVLLPAASLTILSLAMKLVASVSATFVNAILPAYVHQNTDSTTAARRFLRMLTLAVGTTSIVGLVIVLGVRRDLLLPALALALWLLSSSTAAVAQRVSFRFLPPDTSRWTIGGVAVVVALALLSTRAPGFNLTVLLSSYAALDAVAALLLLWLLKDRAMSVLATLMLAGSMAIWVTSLIA
jgi:hypothetical protein